MVQNGCWARPSLPSQAGWRGDWYAPHQGVVSAQPVPARRRNLADGTGPPCCAQCYASFLPLFPTGHRRALGKGIRPRPPDPAAGTPAGAPGLGGEGPTRGPGGAGEDAGSAGSAARYTPATPLRGPHGEPGAAGGRGGGRGTRGWRRHTGQGNSPGSASSYCETWGPGDLGWVALSLIFLFHKMELPLPYLIGV